MSKLTKALTSPFKDTWSSYTSPYQGGFRPTGTGAIIGAGIGAIGTSMIPNTGATDTVLGAGVGAGIGAMSLPALGAVGSGMVWGATNIMPKVLEKGGKAAGIAGGLGAGAVKQTLDFATSSTNANPLYRYGKMASKAFGGVIKYTPETSYLNEKSGKVETRRGRFGLTKKGIIGLGALALARGGASVGEDYINRRQGAVTGVERATPNYMNRVDDAGATGDLVFAMNSNRRG